MMMIHLMLHRRISMVMDRISVFLFALQKFICLNFFEMKYLNTATK